MNMRTILCSILMLGAGCGQPRSTTKVETTSGPTCTSTSGTSIVNGLLTSFTSVLNTAWPSAAVSAGLDPLKDPMVNKKVNLSCKDGGVESGDTICGLQAAKCKEEYAVVTVSSLDGLAYLQFEDLVMSTVTAEAGTQTCPYAPAGGGAYACSYSGPGTGKAYLLNHEVITANMSEIEVKVKCESFKTWTETVFKGSAKCTGSDPDGAGTFQACGGSCASGSAANLSYAGILKLDLKLGKVSCNVSPSYNPEKWIVDSLAPAIEKDLVNAVTPSIERAINNLAGKYMPFPSTCGN